MIPTTSRLPVITNLEFLGEEALSGTDQVGVLKVAMANSDGEVVEGYLIDTEEVLELGSKILRAIGEFMYWAGSGAK